MQTLTDNQNRGENGWLNSVHAGAGESAGEQNLAAAINSELFLRCIHCGLCTSSCPTFLELGDENDGPRGRIQIMRMLSEGSRQLTERMRRHLKLCLDCRGCETACPSGVQYGQLIEPMRLAMAQAETRIEQHYDWFREIAVLRLFPYPERMRRLLLPLRFLQHVGLFDLAERLGLLKLVPGRLGRMIRLLPPPIRQGPKLPKFLPAVGRKRAGWLFFWAVSPMYCSVTCIGPRSGCCSRTAATCSFRPSKAAAGRSFSCRQQPRRPANGRRQSHRL